MLFPSACEAKDPWVSKLLGEAKRAPAREMRVAGRLCAPVGNAGQQQLGRLAKKWAKHHAKKRIVSKPKGKKEWTWLPHEAVDAS
jgi:hypothetical protein